MRYIILFTCALFIIMNRANAQNDWVHPKVYKLNTTNGYITNEGKLIYKATNNPQLKRATFYEYFNSITQCTTNYLFREGNKDLSFTFRAPINSNDFVQIVEMPSSPSPSYSALKINHNQKKEVIDQRLTYGLYRYGNFIEILYVKSLEGKILIKN